MSDNTGSTGAGWFHAEGDPPDTQRYWDGSAWQGEPQPVAPAAPAPTPAMSPPPSFTPPPSTAPPPAFGAAPAFDQPQKKRSVWKWLVGIMLVLFLGIGGCTFAVWRAVSGPIDVGNEFLAALQARDFEGAWALSDPSCFPDGGPELFEQAMNGDTIEAYRLNGSNVTSNNGGSRGSATGTITLAGADVRSVEIFASKPDDDWLVCGFDIGAEGSG